MRAARFHKKHTATSGKPPVEFINPHSKPAPIYRHPKDYGDDLKGESRRFLQIALIDPGSVQCGFRVERAWETGEVTTVAMSCIDFTSPLDGDPPGEIGPFYHYHNVIRFIEKYRILLSQCQYIGIETQLEFVPQNVRLEQTFISGLLALMRDQGCRPIILVMDSSLKTTGLGAPKFDGIKLDGTNPASGRANRVKTQRKKWCLEQAINMLRERGDPFIKIFEELPLSSSYDMGDCTCYGEALRRLLHSGLYRLPLPCE